MPGRPARVLCTGNDAGLLESRCAVLNYSGYRAEAATVSEAEVLLRTEPYDLVIISAQTSEWDRGLILLAAGGTPTYVLHGVTFAAELLAQTERSLIPQKSSGTT
jgi:hypothetical protein